jgi:hypothetical protein
MFCHEALAEVSAKMTAINQAGVMVAFVHMGEESQVAPLMTEHDLEQIARISDPDRRLYAAFGLGRGGAMAMIGPKVWACGIKAGLAGHLPRRPIGNVRQMPGVFLVYQGKMLNGFRASTIADKPDLETFLRLGLEQIADEAN